MITDEVKLKGQLASGIITDKYTILKKLYLLCDILKKTKVNEMLDFATQGIDIGTKLLKENTYSDKTDEILAIVKYLYTLKAPYDFHCFLIALEWDREPSKRFYQPRINVLRSVVDDLTRLANRELELLTISMPPGAGKTTLGLFFILFMIGRDPMKPNIASAYGDKLTKSFFNGILELMLNDEYRVADIFPNLKIVNQNAKDETLDFRDDGKDVAKRFPSLMCASIDGALTGRARAEGVIYSDDLVSGIEEAMNITRLDSLWDKYTANLKSRKKLGCVELHIATRWSLHDPIGRIERLNANNPKAKFIVLSALDENGNSNFDYKYGVGFSTEFFNEIKKYSDPVSFACIYQQQPIEREGLLFKAEDFKYFYELPQEEPDRIFFFCDVAFGGLDYLALPIAYQYGEDVYLVDVVYMRGNSAVTQPVVLAKIMQHKCNMGVFEANNGGDFYANDVYKA